MIAAWGALISGIMVGTSGVVRCALLFDNSRVSARFVTDTAVPSVGGLRVVMSSIHGYGVVAMRGFRRGEVVCYGDGVLYRDADDFDDTYALVLPGTDSGLGELIYWDLVDQTRW